MSALVNDVIIGDPYDGQFVPTAYKATEVRDVFLPSRRNSNCGRTLVNTIASLPGNYPDDLSWEMEA